jgi:hypothetical protein
MLHMHAAVVLGKMKRHFTGVVKTANGLFPKAFTSRIPFFGTYKE